MIKNILILKLIFIKIELKILLTFQLVLRQIKTKKYYNDIKPITQININAFDSLALMISFMKLL